MNQKINDTEFQEIISDLLSNQTVQKMDLFRQHYNTSCLKHCEHVAFYNYIICKKLGLDYISATRAGLLHDLFLYDWRKRSPEHKGLHAFTHPRIALNNSQKLFNLNEKEKDIILKHMWPVTIVPPKYMESFITTFVDKYCAIAETCTYYNSSMNHKRVYRYAYVFLSLLVLPII